MMTEQEVLRRPFDIQVHKKIFINYLEVIIEEDGTIMYAVPSHQEKLIAIACHKLKISRDELNDLCPREYYADFIKWLCLITNCVSLWNTHMEGTPNDKQKESIELLRSEKVYIGRIN